MKSLQRVGVLGHPKRPQTEPVTERIINSLEAHNIQTWSAVAWKPDDIVEQIEGSDMVVAIGGDGAMFRAARLCAPYDVPVLGLNMGRLGFLTEIASPDDWESSLMRVLDGEYWVERRMMIAATVLRGGEAIIKDQALNDLVISGESAGTMVQLDCYIDGHWATTYNSDALIISTPTGSTAYALSAGGPILPPDLTNILIVPSAAHLSLDRPIVLSEGSQVAVRPSHDNRTAVVATVDGMRLAQIQQDDIIVIAACDYQSRFIRMRDKNYFYRSLLDRLEPRVNRVAPVRTKTLVDIFKEEE